MAEALLSAVPSRPLAGGSLMPISADPQPVQSHCLATCQPSDVKIVDDGPNSYFRFLFYFLFSFSFLFFFYF